MKTTDVDVFLADTRLHDCEAMAGRLDQESAERLARISHPLRRAQFVLGRFLLRQSLRRIYGAAAAGWQLDALQGKPRLVGAGAPEITLSHSRELVACAIARVGIGLDVEYCRERNFTVLAEHFCGPTDLRRFLSLSAAEQGLRFYELWTLKEASFKLNGREMPLAGSKKTPVLVDEEIRHEYFLPREGYLAVLVARSADPIHLIVHSR